LYKVYLNKPGFCEKKIKNDGASKNHLKHLFREAVTQNKKDGPGPVAHTYNPNYLGGRDQEDHGLRSPRAKR
jgi:hypothetical protein